MSTTVSAYVTGQVLPYLQNDFAIDLFYDPFSPQGGKDGHDYRTALARHRAKPYDFFFYQIEDDRRCDFTRLHHALVPGVVLFHDVLFRPEELHWAVGRVWRSVREFVDPHGAFLDGGPSPFVQFEAAQAVATLFSTERNLGEFKQRINSPGYRCLHGGDIPSTYLPYPISPAIKNLQSLQNGRTGVPRIAFAGSPQIEHRAHCLLSVLANLPFRCRLMWMLGMEEQARAQAICREFNLRDVYFAYPRSLSVWKRLIADAQVAVHTLFSVYGDPGPYLQMSLMAAVPCVVTNFSGSSLLPDKVVYKIQPGEREESELADILKYCLERRNGDGEWKRRAELGAEYATEVHSTAAVATELAYVFRRYLNDARTRLADWFGNYGLHVSQIAERLFADEAAL